MIRDRQLRSEYEKAADAVRESELALQQAQEDVRCAGESLRRAIRIAASAEGSLRDAKRWLDRVEPSVSKAG